MKTRYKDTLTRADTPSTRLEVTYGLQAIGKQPKYFSVTATRYSRGRWESGGCMHDEVLQTWPDLAPLVALHLSTADGVPMHAESNGWYFLAGAAGGLGEKYHGGSDKTPAQCLEILANHLRVSLDEAHGLVQAQLAGAGRPAFAAYVGACKSRWKVEAEAAIKEFGL